VYEANLLVFSFKLLFVYSTLCKPGRVSCFFSVPSVYYF